MLIKHLSLSGFRYFQRLELTFPSHINIIVGENAQGKTSVLEAIHFLSLMTSPMASHDREMVNFHNLEEDIPVGRVRAEVIKEDKPHQMEARLILTKNENGGMRLRKEVLIDGVKRKLIDAVGFFNSVLFLPQMTRIIEDGPSERRKYLDRTLSQAYPGYVRALSRFNHAITRRNALLKQLGEQGGDPQQLIYWDDQLSKNGALITSLRAKAIVEMNTEIEGRHANLTDGKELFLLQYLPSLEDTGEGAYRQNSQLSDGNPFIQMTAEAMQAMYRDQLKAARADEIRRGVTTIGPHRDDVLFSANGVDLGVFGSRGQIRTAVMALKLAEVHWLEKKTGEVPVLLLDETLAELDAQRRTDLLKELAVNSQSIMTTTDLDLFDTHFVSESAVWYLQNGAVLEN